MANLVKKKVVIIIPILIILIIFIAFKRNKNIDDRFKNWYSNSELIIDDFMSAGPIFDEFDASINTGIGIGKVNESFYAQTYIDKHKSWYRLGELDENLMSHEKYHVNITETGTRELNRIINDLNPSLDELKNFRKSILNKIFELQDTYDTKTNHGTHIENQDYWEYKSDSLLHVEKKYLEYDFSGAEVFFPVKPKKEFEVGDSSLTQIFTVKKYNIFFEFLTLYDLENGLDTLSFKNYLESLKLSDIDVKLINVGNLKGIKSISVDSISNLKIINLIIPNNDRSYQLRVIYPLKTLRSNYDEIAEQFINSFKIKTSNNNWEKHYNYYVSPESEERTPDGKSELLHFSKSYTSDYSVIYSKPFEYENKLLIPFKAVRHENDQIEQTLLILNDSLKFTNDIDSLYQFIPINISDLKLGVNKIQLGYIPKKIDSTQPYHEFYSTHILYEKKLHTTTYN